MSQAEYNFLLALNLRQTNEAYRQLAVKEQLAKQARRLTDKLK